MIADNFASLSLKTALVIIWLIPELIFGQNNAGKVISAKTNLPVAYVNIAIIGRSIGTVSDMNGNFKISFTACHENDSLHFSMIGYQSKSILVRHFKEDSSKMVYLDPVIYDIEEVVFSGKCKYKQIRIGNPIQTDILRSGFADNSLGSELGIKVNVNHTVRLKDLNLNVSVCTYDSVSYRLNIYQSVSHTEFKNILTEPIYISFTRDETDNHISFDLSEYSIVLPEGEVVIALQLYKDLGKGRLLFHTNFLTGSTLFRKTNDDKWAEASGEIGMYLNGDILK